MLKPNPEGRPTKYSQEMVSKICARLSVGESLRSVCRDETMPGLTTVFTWLQNKQEFREQYDRAKEESADALSDEILDIADDGTNDWMEKENKDGSTYIALNHEHVQRSKLRVDARKWIASKLKPKRYGDKIDMTTNGKDLPTPILNGAIPNNNSDEEGSES